MNAADKVRKIGEEIIALASLLSEETVQDVSAEEVPAIPEEDISPLPKLEDVRAVLADISRKGKTAEMKALLTKFGASKLSDIDPANFPALLAAAREVQDA